MDQNNYNSNIQCTVSSCAFHSAPHSCCTLNAIKVGCCGSNPTKCEGTECASFQLGQGK